MYITPPACTNRTANAASAYSCCAAPPCAEKEQARETIDGCGREQREKLRFSDGFADKGRVMFPDTSKPDNLFGTTSRPQDSAPQLTQRLVGACTQFDVRTILSDVNKQLVSLRIIASIGKGGDAMLAAAYVKKLEKLAGRARKKIQDLDKEDMLRLRKAKAERKKQRQRAEEIKEELRKKQMLRYMKEKSYLLGNWMPTGADACGGRAEAAIAVQAEAIAASETTVLSAGTADGAAALPGAESSAVSSSLEGGVDITV